MNRKMISGLFGLGSLMGVTIANAATVQFTPASLLAAEGAPVGSSITLTLEGVGFTETTVGGGVQLSFDTNILTLDSGLGNNSAVAGTIAASAASNGFDISSASACGLGCEVDMSFTSFSNTFSGDFIIADLVFTVDAAGVTPANLSAGITDGIWFSPSFAPLASQPTYAQTSINVGGVSAVPVPAAVWLFGSGLVGLVGVARRRNA